MTHNDQEEKRNDALRSELIKIAAALARFQHVRVMDIRNEDMPVFGDYARRLKKVADSIGH